MNKKTKRIVAVLVLLIVVVVCLFWPQLDTKEQEQQLAEEESFESVELGDELVLTKLSNKEVTFVEDGSDEKLESVAVAAIQNNSDKTLQLADLHITINNEIFDFQLTTLPAGKTVFVQELNKKSIPESYEGIITATENVVFFQEEPSLYGELFEIETRVQSVTLKNISDSSVSGPIYVYYKIAGENGYEGGITYRVSFEGLEPGESNSAFAGHFQPDTCEVMFVTYVP